MHIKDVDVPCGGREEEGVGGRSCSAWGEASDLPGRRVCLRRLGVEGN